MVSVGNIGQVGQNLDEAAKLAAVKGLDIPTIAIKGGEALMVVAPAVGAVAISAEVIGMTAAAYEAMNEGRLPPEGMNEYAAMVGAYVAGKFDPALGLVSSIAVDEWFEDFCERYKGDPSRGIEGLNPEDIHKLFPPTLTSIFKSGAENSPTMKLFGSYAEMLPDENLGDTPDSVMVMVEMKQAILEAEDAFLAAQQKFPPDILDVQATEEALYAAAEQYETAFANIDLDTLNTHIDYMVKAAGLDADIRERLDDTAFRNTVMTHFEESGNEMGLKAIALIDNAEVFLQMYQDMQSEIAPEEEPAEENIFAEKEPSVSVETPGMS